MNEFMDEEFGVDLSDLVSEDDGNQTKKNRSLRKNQKNRRGNRKRSPQRNRRKKSCLISSSTRKSER